MYAPDLPDLDDPQTRAYRDMSPLDVVDDRDLADMECDRHEPLDPGVPVGVVLSLPVDYERLEWDHGRMDPRTRSAHP